MKQWYADRTAANTEFDVTDDLAAAGLEVWCGKRWAEQRTGLPRYRKPVERPALPCWIFLHLTDQQRIDCAHKHQHRVFLHILDTSGFEDFRQRVEAAWHKAHRDVQAGKALTEYKPGQLLLVTGGAFAGQVGRFLCVVDRKLRIETDGMGRALPMDVHPLDVMAVEC